MANKTELLQVAVTPEQKEKYEAEAKKQDVSLSDYMRECLDNWSTFDVHFLEHMNIISEKLKFPMPIVIQNFITAFITAESAMLETYGTSPKTYKRAFQFSDAGELITGNELSSLVYEQTKKDAETLKRKLEDSARTGKPAKITTEEGTFLAMHRPSEGHVKAEAKYPRMAASKSK
jgi:hypothetical protein